MSQSSSHSCKLAGLADLQRRQPRAGGGDLRRGILCPRREFPRRGCNCANKSRRISMSIVGPAQMLVVPSGCVFSGESDGQVTSQWCVGSSTSVSRKNCAAPFIAGINFLQIFPVAGELVMFPEILAKPRAAHRPHADIAAVNRRGRAPQIGVVMRHPAARAIHDLGRARAGFGQVHAPSRSAARRTRRGCTSRPASNSSRC